VHRVLLRLALDASSLVRQQQDSRATVAPPRWRAASPATPPLGCRYRCPVPPRAPPIVDHGFRDLASKQTHTPRLHRSTSRGSRKNRRGTRNAAARASLRSASAPCPTPAPLPG